MNPSEFHLVAKLVTILYAEAAPTLIPKVFSLIEKWRPLCTESFKGPKGPTNTVNWTQKDIILIAYPNHLQSKDKPPLQVLLHWLSTHLHHLVSAVHVLPFHPSTAYDGYAITDYMAVDPEHGTWDDLHQFEKEGYALMFDLVLNHCSPEHPWFKQFLKDEAPGTSILYIFF